KLKVQRFDAGVHAAKFDLQLVITESPEGPLNGVALYATDLFERSTVERLVGHVRLVLEGVIADPKQKIDEINLLTEQEREQLRGEWNWREAEYPEKCVHELFEEQARRNPAAVAVEHEGESVSYRELNEWANQIAHYLRRQGVGPEVRVGISIKRSV